MSIIKHTIPILEYDTNPYAVIDPTHEKLDLDLPKKCVFAFLGDYIDQFAIHHHAEKVAEFISATKKYPIYVLNDEGEPTYCALPSSSGCCSSHTDTRLVNWIWGERNHFGWFLWLFGVI